MTKKLCTYIICTVVAKEDVVHFQWDKGNLDKSYAKHGITPQEAEEVFLDEESQVEPDMAHSQAEPRFIIIGQTLEGKMLFVIFTFRNSAIRIISARKANLREKQKYAQA